MSYFTQRKWPLVLCGLCIASFVSLARAEFSPRARMVSAHNQPSRQKPAPPIDLEWSVRDIEKVMPPSPAGGVAHAAIVQSTPDAYAAEGKLVVTAQKSRAGDLFDGEPEVKLTFSTRGNVRQYTTKPTRFKAKLARAADDTITDKVPFTIPIGERASIEAEATIDGPDGTPKYTRRLTLYLLADQRKLYTGSSSMTNLEIQKLKDDRAEGLISEEKYQQEIDRLIGGGAVQSGAPVQSATPEP